MKKALPAVDLLRSRYSYDPETGRIAWRVDRGPRKAGEEAGSGSSIGYLYLCVDTVQYPAHRIAWAIVHGRWPAADIDHVNGVRSDNRLCNLREATRSQNGANKPGRGQTGFKGVYKVDGRFAARIQKDGKVRHLGCFGTPQQAHEAYMAAAVALHGEFARAE